MTLVGKILVRFSMLQCSRYTWKCCFHFWKYIRGTASRFQHAWKCSGTSKYLFARCSIPFLACAQRASLARLLSRDEIVEQLFLFFRAFHAARPACLIGSIIIELSFFFSVFETFFFSLPARRIRSFQSNTDERAGTSTNEQRARFLFFFYHPCRPDETKYRSSSFNLTNLLGCAKHIPSALLPVCFFLLSTGC